LPTCSPSRRGAPTERGRSRATKENSHMSGGNAGRAVIDVLRAEQVRYVFGIVGGTFLDVLDALYDDKSVEYVNVRHEQGAAMTGRRGPVFVEIPRDVLNNQTVKAAELTPDRYRATHPLLPHPDAIREAARLVNRAERPLLLVGGGVNWAEANELLVRLADQ